MNIYHQILDLLELEFHNANETYYIPEEKKCLLREVSDILEHSCTEWDIDSIDLSTNLSLKSLCISLISMDIIALNGRNDPLFRLATLADSISFSSTPPDSLRTKFQFKNVAKTR